MFRGKEIKLVNENGQYVIKVTQEAFSEEMQPGKLAKNEFEGPTALSAEEWKEFRSCAGSLQWLAGQTRPDICATVSLSNHGMETAVAKTQAALPMHRHGASDEEPWTHFLSVWL